MINRAKESTYEYDSQILLGYQNNGPPGYPLKIDRFDT